MADIATVIHWQPEAINELTVSELMDWRECARV
ncbi:GpE family phage tail protein [Chitinimonas sp. PSY-7]